jgi:thioredoxin reductase
MYDVIVIGAGPAGLAAAAHTIRHRLRTLMIAPDVGGKAAYRLDLPWLKQRESAIGEETVARLRQYVLAAPEPVRYFDRVQSVFVHDNIFQVHTVEGGAFPVRAVVVATGVEPRALGVPGERRLNGYGVSYSAASHAPHFAGLRVAVVGSDPRALRAVAELRMIAEQVILIIPDAAELAGDPHTRRLLDDARVVVRLGGGVREILGERSVSGVVVAAPDGTVEHFPVDGVFIELGLVAHTEFLGSLVERSPSGQVVVDDRCVTCCHGLFAAGDASSIADAEQMLIALGEGTKAGITATAYVLKDTDYRYGG